MCNSRFCISLCLAVVAFRSMATANEAAEFTPPAIRVPDGFVLELAAAPPLVKHPMLACLDHRGRLFIAETDGRNLRKEELLQEKSRFIRMLEDTDDDGKFDKSTIFADKMVMPEGALWHNNALYVVSAPYLWRLEDTDDDGVADRREKLVGEFNFNGNPNQSGPYLGPCGRIYFTGGVFGYDLAGADGKRLGQGSAAGVYSCRADGTDLEVFGQGPVNPVDVEFTPEGELLSTAAIFDGVDGRHDALIHWIDGALTHTVYGKPLLPDTGYRLPALSRWGQVAPAGLMRYRGTAFGAEYRDNYFACQFNTHKVVRTQIAPHGSTFQSIDVDFLAADAIDFHPTDILEDADGSLLLIDTGGWVYYGCPTSKIAKPMVLGAIYRIRKAGATPVVDPRGRQLDWNATSDEMVTWLDDPRPVVRDRAIDTLVRRGTGAVPALDKALCSSDVVELRRNAVWTLSRIGTPPALQAIRAALADRDATVRQAAILSVGILKDPGASEALRAILRHGPPLQRRTAAAALGQIGSVSSVSAILDAVAREDNDDFLMHAFVYALIRIDESAATAKGLAADNPRVQRAALVALDQMPGNHLTHKIVTPLVSTDDLDLRTTALEIISRHADWAGEIRGVVSRWLTAPRLAAEDVKLTRAVMAAFAGNSQIQSEMNDALARESTPKDTRLLVLDALAESDLDDLPDPLNAPLRKLLASTDTDLVEHAIATISVKETDRMDDLLLKLSRDASRPQPLRLAALATVAKHGSPLDQEAFALLAAQLDDDGLPVDRVRAAEALAAANLSHQQSLAVADLLARARSLELPVLLRRFERDAAAVVVNVDAQPAGGKTHRGLAAFADDPQGGLAIWNAWDPTTGTGVNYPRTSDGSYSGIWLSKMEGASLLPHFSNQFDNLMGDFFYNGQSGGGGEHQSFRSRFILGGLKLAGRYELYFYGSRNPSDPPRGASVTIEDANGHKTENIHGLKPGDKDYAEGKTHALFRDVVPKSNGTIEISWSASTDDTDANHGVFNGLTIVAPPAGHGRDVPLGQRIVAGLGGSQALTNLVPDRIQKLLDRFPPEIAEAGTALVRAAGTDRREQAERLAELMSQIDDGDARRGREIYFGNRALCHTCHRAENRGGDIGPDLSQIARIRNERDLTESIVFPSSTIAGNYQTFNVYTLSGQTHVGVIGRQSATAIHLRMAGKPEQRIARDDIEEMSASATSIMPSGLEKVITIPELRDLIAYLKTLK